MVIGILKEEATGLPLSVAGFQTTPSKLFSIAFLTSF
jgi:hypothetical protein